MKRQNEFRDFIIWWNNTFIYDKWWREKYKIAFNSPEHRLANQIDIFIEYSEDKLFREIVEEDTEKKRLDKYFNTGKWFDPVIIKPTEAELDSFFEAADLDSFDEVE